MSSRLRFDPKEIQYLLEKAQSGDKRAEENLLFRFQRLVATLVNVCLTGRINYRSSYQKTFLRYFASDKTPLDKVAAMLQRNLRTFDRWELFGVGRTAVLDSIHRCKGNLASTIVGRFKDLIAEMIADPTVGPIGVGLSEDIIDKESSSIEENVAFQLFLEGLTEEEWVCAKRIISGEDPKEIPDSLREKLRDYLDS